MADITKIRLDGSDYDIKDQIARDNRLKILNLSSTDNIQDALNTEGAKIIVLPAGVTFTFSDVLFVNSDTILDLNGSTIVFDYQRSSIFSYDWDETLGFMSYHPDSTYTGYDGVKNVTIKNGTIAGGCSCFLHSQNITFDNVTFTSLGCRHAMQLAGCKNFTVKNCTFNGTLTVATALKSSECINIDPCTYGAQPYISEYSTMFDHTKNMNIVIENNKFNPTNSPNRSYQTAVGGHGGDDGYVVAENVIIRNNDFTDPLASGINIRDFDNVVIENNIQTGNISSTSAFIIKRGAINNAEVNNNIVNNINNFFYNDTPSNAITNLNCCGNKIVAIDNNSDANGVFLLINVHDSVFADNDVKFQHHAVFIRDKDYWDGTSVGTSGYSDNVVFKNNRFEKTVASAQYWNIRLGNSTNLSFVNNSFVHDDTLQSNYYDFLVQSNVTFTSVQGNTTDSPAKFVDPAKVTEKFWNNNAVYIQNAIINSATASGTLKTSASNYRAIILNVGSSSKTQTFTLEPFYNDGVKLTNRTYTFQTESTGGTVASSTFTISNGTDWSYSGSGNLRMIICKD